MNMEKNYSSFNQRQKALLNETADENIIYDEIQTGPQEAPVIYGYEVDVKKWRKYHNQKKKMIIANHFFIINK